MTGLSFNPNAPKAVKTFCSGKFGRFLHVLAGESRLMTSQVSVAVVSEVDPVQTSSLEKSLKKNTKLVIV